METSYESLTVKPSIHWAKLAFRPAVKSWLVAWELGVDTASKSMGRASTSAFSRSSNVAGRSSWISRALAVAIQIAYRLVNPTLPVFETMGIAGLTNLAANATCLWLLTPYRRLDINMGSAWECSRNDILEGIAVLAAAGAVALFDAGWPDLVAAGVLLILVLRSGIRVLREALASVRTARAEPE